MPPIVDLSKFTFTAEQIRDINELVFDDILHAPDLSVIHTMYSGIVYDREIGFITGGGLVGKAEQGCDPDSQDWAIGTRKVVWTPKGWEIRIEECASDLNNTMVVYAKNNGIRIDDLTDTDYMAILVIVLTDAIRDFFYRLVWFNDTDAANVSVESLPVATVSSQTSGSAIVGTVYAGVASTAAGAVKCALSNGTIVYLSGTAVTGNAVSGTTYYTKDTANKNTVLSGGIITAGVDTGYFTILDGLFKQLQAAVTVDSSLLSTISANSQSTKAAQLSAMDGDAAYALLNDMYFKAPIELRTSGNMQFLVTQSIADAYLQYLMGKGIESTYRNLVDGLSSLSFLGVEVIAMPIWDKMIHSYNDLGATYYKPHRAVLIEKANLAVGTPSEEAYEGVDVWYDKKSRKNFIEAKDKLDAKLLNPARLVYAQ